MLRPSIFGRAPFETNDSQIASIFDTTITNTFVWLLHRFDSPKTHVVWNIQELGSL
ncbi:hypothetical protein RE6C_04792 [Rhodopirellula europaea 6C]|uniref:Uncharacterized protein n=1 Tax=Rhodopirellula europaea 6C TaxID=1263867 RepID=M2AC28_9BACT|nr:hypothetical protein RE6C_04792 [Rhodopirellula europaea 6C]